MPAVRLCLEVTPWPNTTLAQGVEAAAQAGFGCLDLHLGQLEDYLSSAPLVQLDYHLRAQRIYVAAITVSEPLPVGDEQALLLTQARLLQACVHLDALGGGILTVYPQLPTTPAPAKIAGEADALRILSALAAPFDVRIAIASPSPAHSARLVEQAARPNVFFALEAQTLRQGTAELSSIELERLALVHMGEIKRAVPPDPDAAPAQDNLRRACAWLAERGFSGPYSVRPAGNEATFFETVHQAHRAAASLFAAR